VFRGDGLEGEIVSVRFDGGAFAPSAVTREDSPHPIRGHIPDEAMPELRVTCGLCGFSAKNSVLKCFPGPAIPEQACEKTAENEQRDDMPN
jgi:hypothetical protein